MSNVTALPGSKVPNQKPNEALITMLNKLLRHAEDGRLQSFIGTGFQQDGCRVAIWVDTHDNVYEMLGALAWLQAEYVNRHTHED